MTHPTHQYGWRSPKSWCGTTDNPLFRVHGRVLCAGGGRGRRGQKKSPRNVLFETTSGRRIVVNWRALRRIPF